MWYVCAFYIMLPLSIFCIGGVVIYISRAWVILPLRHIHICACIDMFVYVIQSNFLVVLHLGYLVLFLSSAWVIISLHHRCIWFCVHMLVNIISVFTDMCWYNLYDIFLGCNPSWEYCHSYFLYMVCYSIFTIIVGLHAKNQINILLF